MGASNPFPIYSVQRVYGCDASHDECVALDGEARAALLALLHIRTVQRQICLIEHSLTLHRKRVHDKLFPETKTCLYEESVYDEPEISHRRSNVPGNYTVGDRYAGHRVVTIGGGTGTFSLLSHLKKYQFNI